jgi:hypothetical protein
MKVDPEGGHDPEGSLAQVHHLSKLLARVPSSKVLSNSKELAQKIILGLKALIAR